MKLSVDTAVRLGRLGLGIGRTWRFRDADDPGRRVGFPPDPVILACWHEYLTAFAMLGRGRGIASLASRHDDGEIIARVVSPLGFVMARGSSSRGGVGGFRKLLRAAQEHRTIYLTTDGPRGPRHTCQPGVVRLAQRSGVPIVPIGMSAVSGFRLGSWDRHLVPTPGTRVFVAFGEPISVDGEADPDLVLPIIERETTRAVRRAEAVAREGRRGRAYRIRRGDSGAGDAPRPRGALAGRIESSVRAAWQRRPPRPDLKAASLAFRAGRTARHALFDSGIFSARTAPIPVISIGGITVGGAGKTPLASEVAGWLLAEGRRPAILTRGYRDELRLHRELQPEAVVLGHRDRVALTWRATGEGADVALLDDGFQHRRLARDLDIVAIDRDALRRTNGAALPAGPFRESVARASRRADALVLIGREPRDPDVAAWERDWVLDHGDGAPIAIASLSAGSPVRVRGTSGHAPNVALTGVMKPNLFFDVVRASVSETILTHAVPDHGIPGAELVELIAAARAGGFIMTRKDYARLERLLPDDLDIWVVPERLAWHSGRDELGRMVFRAAEGRGPC